MEEYAGSNWYNISAGRLRGYILALQVLSEGIQRVWWYGVYCSHLQTVHEIIDSQEQQNRLQQLSISTAMARGLETQYNDAVLT